MSLDRWSCHPWNALREARRTSGSARPVPWPMIRPWVPRDLASLISNQLRPPHESLRSAEGSVGHIAAHADLIEKAISYL
jgi:hypothetical protein